MKAFYRIYSVLFLLLGQVLFSSFVEEKQIPLQDGSVSVIVNPALPVEELSVRQLKDIYRGDQIKWANRTKIVIALMKSNTPTGKYTAERVLGYAAGDIDKYYLNMVFQGKMSAPKTFNSEVDLKAFVAANPGAIGIVSRNIADDVKILKIGGKTEI